MPITPWYISINVSTAEVRREMPTTPVLACPSARAIGLYHGSERAKPFPGITAVAKGITDRAVPLTW